ncbi:MAG: hypothetical protein KC444_09285 [Nitrosopumilus sp.]|nr:hypothetical protein [Nitrosopumilus sp.]
MSESNKPIHTSDEFEIETTKEDEPTLFRSTAQLWAHGFKAKTVDGNRIQVSGYFRMVIDPISGETWSFVTPRDD